MARRAFERAASSVGRARRFVTAALTEAEVPSTGVVDLARLAVSELATNAIEHAGTAFEVVVALEDGDDVVRIAVHDGSPVPPTVRPGAVGDARGRGLRLLDAIAARWGCDANGGGKWIWCELDLSATLRTTADRRTARRR